MKIFYKFPTVNTSKLNFWLVICIAKNFIWTALKAIFSIFRFCLHPVRDPTLSQSPQSPATTLIRSQSPEYWSPAPAACNQHSFKYTLHSDTHRLVYRSPTWTSLTLSILTFMCLPSDPPVLLRSHSPLFLHDPDPPAKNPTSIITDKNQRNCHLCYCSPHLSISSLIQPTCQ